MGSAISDNPSPWSDTGPVSSRRVSRRSPDVSNLPLEALKVLSQPHVGVAVGQVWQVSTLLLNYHQAKPRRYCVIAAMETARDSGWPIRAHLIVGSTKPERDDAVPEIMVRAGDAGLPSDTFFSLRLHSEVTITDLRTGVYIGTLGPSLCEEMLEAISESTLVAVKTVLASATRVE